MTNLDMALATVRQAVKLRDRALSELDDALKQVIAKHGQHALGEIVPTTEPVLELLRERRRRRDAPHRMRIERVNAFVAGDGKSVVIVYVGRIVTLSDVPHPSHIWRQVRQSVPL